MKVETGSYVGSPGAQTISLADATLSIDFLIVVRTQTEFARYRTSDGVSWDSASECAQTGGALEDTTCITSIATAGEFSLGTNVDVNNDGQTYYYLAIDKEGEEDFFVGTYTGDSDLSQAITGLGFEPGWVQVFAKNSAICRVGFAAGISLDSSSSIDSLDSDGFTVDGSGNTDGQVYRFIAMKNSVSGATKSGSYTGDGTEPRDIDGLGFDPEVALVVNTSRGSRGDPNSHFESFPANASKDWDLSNWFSGDDKIEDLGADKFTVGNDTGTNRNLDSYAYFAFKTNPASTGGDTATPDAAEFSLEIAEPTIVASEVVTPAAAELSLEVADPAVALDDVVTPNASVSVSVIGPAVVTGDIVTPGTPEIALDATGPIASAVVSPSAASMSIAIDEPTVQLDTSSEITPPAAGLAVGVSDPVIDEVLVSNESSFAFECSDPSVLSGVVTAPTASLITLSVADPDAAEVVGPDVELGFTVIDPPATEALSPAAVAVEVSVADPFVALSGAGSLGSRLHAWPTQYRPHAVSMRHRPHAARSTPA